MKYSISIPVYFLLLLLISGCAAQGAPDEHHAHDHEEEGVFVSPNAEQIALAGIELGLPERRPIAEYIECAARVEAPPQSVASVYAPVNGFIRVARHYHGAYVRKGELLTTIEHPDLVRLQREFLECRSRLRALELDFQRKTQLAGAEAASQRALEQAQADFGTEKARFQGLRAEIALLGLSLEKLEKEGAIQSRLHLRAPMSGYLSVVNINLGKLVGPSDLLFEILDNQHLHLEIEVFAKDLPLLRAGQRVEAFLPGTEGVFPAQVHLIGKTIDPGTKTARAHAHFSDEPIPLPVGAYLRARVLVRESEALTLPQSAMVREGDDFFVFVKQGEHFEKTTVRAGRAEGDYIEILALELGPGEQVALKGAYYLQGMLSGGEGHSH